MLDAAKIVLLTDQLKHAIIASGKTRYRICKDVGLDQAILSRFMTGRRSLRLEHVEVLAAYLGLRLVSSQETVR